MFRIAILPTIILLTIATNAHAQSFNNWLIELKREAMEQGISHKTVRDAFKGYDPQTPKYEKILKLDKNQPEFKKTFAQYVVTSVSKSRVSQGQKLFKKHRALLTEIGNKYCVQPQFIVALWGIETNYGTFTGGHKVIHALATLAYDGRSEDRKLFFRKELLKALRIIEDGHISSTDMFGSWAGAMGQSQFMPSSFLAYAVDYDKDGKKDIWNNKADIFASIANYLSTVGWDCTQRWGREVKLNKPISDDLEGRKIKKELNFWQDQGVTKPNGAPIPVVKGMKASLVYLDKKDKTRTFLTYGNYDTIMHWNRSTYFATSVGMLADKINWVTIKK